MFIMIVEVARKTAKYAIFIAALTQKRVLKLSGCRDGKKELHN